MALVSSSSPFYSIYNSEAQVDMRSLTLLEWKFLAAKTYSSDGLSAYPYLFTRTDKTKYHKLSALKDRNVFSQFWRLEVQDQGVSSICFF